jgi:hypothetical protein
MSLIERGSALLRRNRATSAPSGVRDSSAGEMNRVREVRWMLVYTIPKMTVLGYLRCFPAGMLALQDDQ